MNNTVERLLYIALALIVFGVTIAMIVLFSFGSKIDQELRQLKTIQDQQIATIATVQRGVDEIKANNTTNTQLIECLINLHASGIVPNQASCQDLDQTRPASPPNSPNPGSTAASSAAPAPSPSSTPGNAVSRLTCKVLGLFCNK